MHIVLPKTKKGDRFYEVPTVHGNLGAGGVAKIVGAKGPKLPVEY